MDKHPADPPVPDPVAVVKRRLRAEITARWSRLSPVELAAGAGAATRQLLALPEWRRAGTIFTYLHMASGELPTDGVVQAAIQQGKRVTAPVILKRGWMEAYAFCDLSRLQPRDFGIRAPDPDHHIQVPPEEIDLVIVPALAFDRAGFRLGRGGGYYDRYLARLEPHTVTVGWTLQEFLYDRLPVHPHDIPVHMVITEVEVWRRPSAV